MNGGAPCIGMLLPPIGMLPIGTGTFGCSGGGMFGCDGGGCSGGADCDCDGPVIEGDDVGPCAPCCIGMPGSGGPGVAPRGRDGGGGLDGVRRSLLDAVGAFAVRTPGGGVRRSRGAINRVSSVGVSNDG